MAKVSPRHPRGKARHAKKLYPDFPLTPHPSGQWCKKVRGRIHYFGREPDDALAKWLQQRDYLLSGRRPPENHDGLTVRDLVNHFLTERQHRVDAGDSKRRTFQDYHKGCEAIIKAFGPSRQSIDNALRTNDFRLWRHM